MVSIPSAEESARGVITNQYVLSMETEPYIKRIERRLKHWIPKHDETHCSLEFMFDPGGFACDRPKIVACVVDHGLEGLVDDVRTDEAELYGG